MEQQKNQIIVGSKPVTNYMPAIIFAFEQTKIITLSAIGGNINKMERLVNLFKMFNVKETNREYKNIDELRATIVTLERADNAK